MFRYGFSPEENQGEKSESSVRGGEEDGEEGCGRAESGGPGVSDVEVTVSTHLHTVWSGVITWRGVNEGDEG